MIQMNKSVKLLNDISMFEELITDKLIQSKERELKKNIKIYKIKDFIK